MQQISFQRLLLKTRLKSATLSLLFVFIFSVNLAHSQQQIKIMTYNLLNYPNTDTNIRNPHFRTIINAVNPDVLVVSEINTQSGVNSFLNNVLNYTSNLYSAGTYIDGFDSDNALFYKSSVINFISNTRIYTQLRDINEFKISDKKYSDTLIIYAVHLRAGDTSIVRRRAEIDSLRKKTNLLPKGTDFIALGDFNIYGSFEPAYQKLLQDNPTDDGNFIDHLNLTGTWNSSAYRFYHTQSTRTRSFGDGATGGLDDRFDMILNSNSVVKNGGIKFLSASYTAYGNDGNHYNDSINKIPNTSVTQTVANALHYASDHLPVFASFEFGNATQVEVKVIVQGLYNPSINKLNRRDSVKIYFRKNESPYLISDTVISLADSINFTCSGVSRRLNEGNYFIQIRHRNSIETWSKTGGEYFSPGDNFSYDFTDSSNKAFGSNLILYGSKYCIYNGDTNQDGFIDGADNAMIENEALNFVLGFTITDLNGDNITDGSDAVIADNNASSFVSSIRP